MSEGRRTVCVDLDGVLARYDRWRGEDVFGEPYEGAREFLERLKEEGWTVLIYTARRTDCAEAWLDLHGMRYDAVNRSPEFPGRGERKPPADAYVDDRGFRFEGDFGATLEFLRGDTSPWYKRKDEGGA